MADEDHYPRKSVSITTRSLSFQMEDLQNLSLYIKNLNDNINNIDNQLSKPKINQSLINSDDIINESEDDDVIHPPIKQKNNPFSRNSNAIAIKRYSTHLFNTTFKERLFNRGINNNNTSITEDSIMGINNNPSIRKHNQIMMPMTITDNEKMNMTIPYKTEMNTVNTSSNTNTNSTKNIKSSPMNKPKGKTIRNNVGLSDCSFKESNGSTITKTNYEKYATAKKSHYANEDSKIKALGNTFIYENNHHKLSQAPLQVQVVHPKTSFFPYELIPTKKKTNNTNQTKKAVLNQKKIILNNNKNNTSINNKSNNKCSNNKVYNSTQVKKTVPPLNNPRKELIDYKTTVKPYNDKNFTEIFLLCSEFNKLSNDAFPIMNDILRNQYDYYNNMKIFYTNKNNACNQMTIFKDDESLSEKEILSLIHIQRHWRKWHINKLIKATPPKFFPHHILTEKDTMNKAKLLFYHQLLKKDENFKEMIQLMQKLNESYTNCLNNKYFKEYKTMMLNDFKSFNKKGDINENSNIINLNIQLKKMPSSLLLNNSLIMSSAHKNNNNQRLIYQTKKLFKNK